tara:strand:- start:161 stop:541 length:381 start_codon:yes stop_codon:yes gene_type:complete
VGGCLHGADELREPFVLLEHERPALGAQREPLAHQLAQPHEARALTLRCLAQRKGLRRVAAHGGGRRAQVGHGVDAHGLQAVGGVAHRLSLHVVELLQPPLELWQVDWRGGAAEGGEALPRGREGA